MRSRSLVFIFGRIFPSAPILPLITLSLLSLYLWRSRALKNTATFRVVDNIRHRTGHDPLFVTSTPTSIYPAGQAPSTIRTPTSMYPDGHDFLVKSTPVSIYPAGHDAANASHAIARHKMQVNILFIYECYPEQKLFVLPLPAQVSAQCVAQLPPQDARSTHPPLKHQQ